MDKLQSELNSLSDLGLFRELCKVEGLDFSSNNYLGLANNEEIKSQLVSWIQNQTQLGGTASRLVRGNTLHHIELEDELALFLGRPATLLFSSGYVANEGVISALAKDTMVFSDSLNHASIIDGIRLSRSPYKVFRHNDMNHLQKLLASESGRLQKIVITESVFSMDGDLAPIGDILRLAERYDCKVIIDEAHATGVFGKNGAGCLSQQAFDCDRVVSVHTCSKALGAYGAFVGCSQLTKKFLINRCRHFIYTTALPPIVIGHIKIALNYLMKHFELIEKLKFNSEYARSQISELGDTCSSESQIVPLLCAGNQRVLQLSKYVCDQGFDVKAIRSPTVTVGKERLRISVHADHTLEQLNALVESLSQGIMELGP